MLPDRVSNPGPLTYESGALPIALRGPATVFWSYQDDGWMIMKGCVQMEPCSRLKKLPISKGAPTQAGHYVYR